MQSYGIKYRYIKLNSSRTMNPAKMYQCGMDFRVASSFEGDSAGVRAGVHSRTNVYIDPSKRDWINPRHRILWSKNKRKPLHTSYEIHHSSTNPILIHPLRPTSLPVSTPNTIDHSCLTVCLPPFHPLPFHHFTLFLPFLHLPSSSISSILPLPPFPPFPLFLPFLYLSSSSLTSISPSSSLSSIYPLPPFLPFTLFLLFLHFPYSSLSSICPLPPLPLFHPLPPFPPFYLFLPFLHFPYSSLSSICPLPPFSLFCPLPPFPPVTKPTYEK